MLPKGPRGASRRPTLSSIAAAADVHPSTVSRVLNGDPNARVPSKTADRIRRLASEMGYEPDHVARVLRTGRTLTIGVVIPRLTDLVLSTMVEAASERARELGYQTVTVSTRDHDSTQRDLIDSLLDRRIDGLILATAHLEDSLPAELRAEGVPLVLMNRLNSEIPAVSGDDEEGGFLAAQHLFNLGHTRIGIVAGPKGVSTGALRVMGFRRAHDRAGISVDEDLVVHSSFSLDGGELAAKYLLGSPRPPSGIVAVNDFVAMGVMAEAAAQGLRIPQDISVVGYNDIPLAAKLPIPLSSVSLPLDDIGRHAVDMLLAEIQGRGAESTSFPPLLRPRASSSRPSFAKA